MKTALITGGGSGIGQALAWQLAKQSLQVFITGRRLNKLEETASHFPDRIYPIQADVSLASDRTQIASSVKDIKLDYLVHNAGISEPSPIANMDLEVWRSVIAINLEAPLFLTQTLLPQFKKGSRILHISSGLAHRTLKGTLAYSVSKAGLHMVFRALNLELNEQGIYTGSVMPGVVDTEMQARARARDKSELPDVAMFKGFKEQGVLRSPVAVASLLSQFLEKTSNKTFTEKDWSIDELSIMFKS